MKKVLKNVVVATLALSLALGISAVPSEAKAIKGVVATLTAGDEYGGASSVSSWNEAGNFSSDFTSYTVSADVYLPTSMLTAVCKEGGKVFITPQVKFWFGDAQKSGYLEHVAEIVIDYDFENNQPAFWGNKPGDVRTDEVPVKNVEVIGDMIKIEIVDAPVDTTMKSDEWGDDGRLDWSEEIQTTGDATPLFQVGTDRPVNGKYVVTNASVKIGDKEYKTDYTTSETIAGYEGIEGYKELKASTFNTVALSVAKTSVKVKKKKSTTVKVTTMFGGDKVTVSSSSAKVAKATYKSGKVTIKGLKKGKATITVKANGKTKKIKVTVKKK